jgi:alkylated DNA nucleotide flippase Atl1
MEPQTDVIVAIEKHRERYFGGAGKMLIPCPATVAAQIRRIPEHQLMSKELLQATLAEQFQVQVTCPFATKKALQAIAQDASQAVPYWRVIKKSGELFSYFPGGLEGHANCLRQEGFTIDTTGKVPRIQHFKEFLVRLASSKPSASLPNDFPMHFNE